MRYSVSLIAIVFATAGGLAHGQETAGDPASPEQRPAEREAQERPGTVDIREYEEGTQAITEYRRFGQLYMLKVKPKGLAPLYMIDQYGDGELNRRPAESIEDDVNLPKWRLGNF